MGKNGPQPHVPVAQNIAVQHLSAARLWGPAPSPACCLQVLAFLDTQHPEPWELPTRIGQAIRIGAQFVPFDEESFSGDGV